MDLEKIREIHNSIKNDLINDAYSHIPYTLNILPTSVLDLACGRGGDMHKFYHPNFKKVICVDNHIPSLEIAKKDIWIVIIINRSKSNLFYMI